MKNQKTAIISLIAFLAVITLMTIVSASENYIIQTANNTELNGTRFNTQTPTVAVYCSLNASSWNMTIVNVSNNVVANRVINNGTWTNVTLVSMPLRTRNYLNLSCVNATNPNLNNGTFKTIEINGQPSITSVFTNSSIILKNSPRTFVVNWTDVYPTGQVGTDLFTDNVTFYVCRTATFSNNCSSVWCQTPRENDNSTQCDYTIEPTSTAGGKSYYVYAMDANGNLNATSTNGNFTVAGGAGDGDEDQVITKITTTKPSWTNTTVAGIIKLPYLILLLAIVIIAIIIVYYSKKR